MSYYDHQMAALNKSKNKCTWHKLDSQSLKMFHYTLPITLVIVV